MTNTSAPDQLNTCAKYIIRYGIFKIKVNSCILIHLISNYDFWGIIFLKPCFTYIIKENWKEDCNSNNTLKIFLLARR